MSYGEGYDGERARTLPAQTRTRTRLPDDPDDVPTRSAASPRRSLVTIVSVVVLLLGAIVVANQTGGEGGEGSTGAQEQDGEGGQAAPTAPSGDSPVEVGTSGLPSGFSQSEQGAESAAANYAVALGSSDMFDPVEREAIVAAVYTPEAALDQGEALQERYTDPDFLASIGLAEDGSAPEGMTFVSRVLPVGTRVVEFSEDADAARVEVWYAALFGLAGEESTNPVVESWYTGTYDLAWSGDDWKVTGYSQEDGPVPVARDQRASSAEEMAEAVEEFGGFTYAR
ncbi:hypothetical protein ACTWP5_02955 [Streptomyces sp. 4N509B]|uniref:hypothetical protein n=1 Tax=Streptomyces sp. 4N509B TaxID=3457413 RepID=UPI003FD07A29